MDVVSDRQRFILVPPSCVTVSKSLDLSVSWYRKKLACFPQGSREIMGYRGCGVSRFRLQWSPPHRILLSGAFSHSAVHWLMPPAAQPGRHHPRLLTSAYWHNHRSHLLCLATYVGLHVLLFALAASAHRAFGTSIMVAKGCGQCLNFDCSFIVVGFCGYNPRKWAEGLM